MLVEGFGQSFEDAQIFGYPGHLILAPESAVAPDEQLYVARLDQERGRRERKRVDGPDVVARRVEDNPWSSASSSNARSSSSEEEQSSRACSSSRDGIAQFSTRPWRSAW
jgi:hypothetical protein